MSRLVKQLLLVSWTEYLFDPLQQLLSPSAAEQLAGSWSCRIHFRSTQCEQRIKLCTNSFQILEQVDVMLIVRGINVDQVL